MLVDKFKKLISNNFDNRDGVDFSGTRLPFYLKESERMMADDLPDEVYIDYKIQSPSDVSGMIDNGDGTNSFDVINPDLFSANGKVILTNDDDFVDISIVKEVVGSTITIYNGGVTYPTSNLSIKTKLRDELESAIVNLTAGKHLHKFIALDEQYGMVISETTGIGSATKFDLESMERNQQMYLSQYDYIINKYQEDKLAGSYSCFMIE